jgi:hypothetical protein
MPSSGYILDYSIVICAFNPDDRILKRCLTAVRMLDKSGLRTEVILADNNSRIHLKELPYVKECMRQITGMKIIHVEQPGVQFARMAAIRESGGQYIVYIDSDNEPHPDYLQELKKLNNTHPEVACWGPGNVHVDFLDGIDKNMEDYARNAFQEKHVQNICFDNKKEWQFCYPVGTGLCTFSSVLKEYVNLAERGKFSLPGRKGNLLSSGEDTQMILLAISRGFFAGTHPSLKLEHMIPGTRANTSYLRRLIFGTSSCFETCQMEVFPDHESILKEKMLNRATFTRRACREFIKTGFGLQKIKTFNFILWLGTRAGCYYALGIPLPPVVQRIIKYLKLE